MKKLSKARFPIILLCSAVFHLGVLGVLYGSWVVGVALKFGSFSFDDSGSNREKVTMLDRTKPLYLPRGFYAVETPPEKVTKREKKATIRDTEKARKEDEKATRDGDERETGEPKDRMPPSDGKFGHISGRALKPHIQQIYRAYEQGRISVTSFTVTVSCKAQPDGSLSDITLAKSSGDDLIDATAVNIVTELGAMRALGPLARLSSLSITLQKAPTSATLTAVGFANDPDVSAGFANQLGLLKFASRIKMQNEDQRALLNGVQVAQSGNRVSASLALPSSMAGDMMRRNFSATAHATPGG